VIRARTHARTHARTRRVHSWRTLGARARTHPLHPVIDTVAMRAGIAALGGDVVVVRSFLASFRIDP